MLTNGVWMNEKSPHDRGGMAEWLKAPVLKTGVRKDRGFESYSLRHFFLFNSMTWLSCTPCFCGVSGVSILLFPLFAVSA